MPFSSASAASPEFGSVVATVDGSGGEPVAGAAVTLTGNGPAQTARTDRRGMVTLSGVAAGTWIASAVARGYAPLGGRTIEVDAERTVALTFDLSRATSSLVVLGHVRTEAGETLSTSSAPVQELDAATFAARGTASVAQAIESDSISTTVIHPAGGNPAAPVVIALRGPDPTETLVDIDGQSINSGSTGAFDLSLLDPAQLASVQLVYGISPSSLIGPDTIDGAINLRTIDPTPAAHGLVRFSLGSFGTAGETLQATGSDGAIGYALSWHRSTIAGEVGDQTIPTGDGGFANVGGAMDGDTGLAKLRYTFDHGNASAEVTLLDQSEFRDLSAALSSIVSEQPLSFNSFAGSSLASHGADYGFDVTLPVGEQRSDGTFPVALLIRHSTFVTDQSVAGEAAGTTEYLEPGRDVIGEEAVEADAFGEHSSLSATLSLRNETLDTQSVPGGAVDQSTIRMPFDSGDGAGAASPIELLNGLAQTQRSAALRYSVDPDAKMHYTFAAYLSDFSAFGTSLDPRLGVVWTPTARSALRMSVGTTFQSPQLPELYVPPVLPTPDSNGYIDVGNPNLKADHATDMDAGYEHIFSDDGRSRASIDVYRTDLRTPSQQYIPPHQCTPGSETPPRLCLSFPINIGGAVYQGIEARAERDLSESLHVRAAYGVASAFPTSVAPQFQNGNSVPNEQFEGVPLHKGSLSLERNATGDGLAYSAGVVYESANNELNRPAFATVQAGITWIAKALEFGLYGDNLTNVYDDRFTLAQMGVPYAGAAGPIPTDAYSLAGRSVTFVITRRL